MEKKRQEELKDQYSENRFDEFKKLLQTAKATIKTSSSNPTVHPTPLVILLRLLLPRHLHYLLLSPLVQAMRMNLLKEAKQERKRRRR